MSNDQAVSGGPAAGDTVVSRGGLCVTALTWRPYARREPVLRGIDLHIPNGQRVLLVGPSGAGKSTLLRALGGLLESDGTGELTGSVTVEGHRVGQRAGEVGLVLQEPGAGVVAASVERDVAFGPENVGTPREQMPPMVADALAAVRLRLPPDTSTATLSGGQTQRLAMAGAAALAPSVLLLDEPTAMLDETNAAAVRASVAAVADRYAATTIVVEHLLGPWLPFVDRVIALGMDGQVIADATPAEVLSRHGADLADAGLWVPGFPLPPLPDLPDDLLLPSPAPQGEPGAAWAREVRVERDSQRVDGSIVTATAVANFSATTEPGRIIALMGDSGAGKSTALMTLAGVLAPTSGEATPGALPSPDLARRLAWVPQWASAGLVAGTVLDEALATSRALGLPEDEVGPRAEQLLAAVGLGDLQAADPRLLSGGEQRRLAVVAAVVHGPAAVLADEPTIGQDRHTWAAVVGVLEAFRNQGGAVVVATHDLHLAARADEVDMMTAPAEEPAAAPLPLSTSPWLGRQATYRRARYCPVIGAGPLALVGGALLPIAAGILSPNWRASVWVLLVELALAVLGMGWGIGAVARYRRAARRMIPGLVAALSVAWSTWLLGGQSLDLAATGFARILVIVLPSAVLVPFIDPDLLGDHLGQRLRLPARPVVAIAAALHRVHRFGDSWTEMTRARRVRGLAPHGLRGVAQSVRTMTVGLLIRALSDAAALALAMDARGFAAASRRTWYHRADWHRVDTIVVLAAALPIVVAAGFR
ncbi:MAG: ATP-binding cassette domain-containing protein [Nostocoides sp.]